MACGGVVVKIEVTAGRGPELLLDVAFKGEVGIGMNGRVV